VLRGPLQLLDFRAQLVWQQIQKASGSPPSRPHQWRRRLLKKIVCRHSKQIGGSEFTFQTEFLFYTYVCKEFSGD
jgi:hypothetical protein